MIVAQLVKRQADVESDLDSKLKDLRDDHEQQCQQLASELEAKKQKLNDDFQRYVSADVLFFLGSLIPWQYSNLCRIFAG